LTTIPTRRLGLDGVTVGAIGYGAMSFGTPYGQTDVVADADRVAHEIVDRAIEIGVTLIDTADVHGASEDNIGYAIRGRRDRIVLATKFGIVQGPFGGQAAKIDGTPAYMRERLERSLTRLGTDYIDLYYVHRIDPGTPIEETVGALSEMVAEGKIRHIGLSEAAPETIRRAAAVHPITAVQREWSLWERSIETEIVPFCRELGIGIVPYSPLGRGALTGALRTRADLPEGDHRRNLPWYSQENMERNIDAALNTLGRISSEHGATAGQVALAWLLAKGPDVVPIPGTRRVPFMEENAMAANLELSAGEIEALDAIAPTGEREQPSAMAATNWADGISAPNQRPAAPALED
jgi:aryl-alcohol dehydrogenase-like predicted oxidoreductase